MCQAQLSSPPNNPTRYYCLYFTDGQTEAGRGYLTLLTRAVAWCGQLVRQPSGQHGWAGTTAILGPAVHHLWVASLRPPQPVRISFCTRPRAVAFPAWSLVLAASPGIPVSRVSSAPVTVKCPILESSDGRKRICIVARNTSITFYQWKKRKTISTIRNFWIVVLKKSKIFMVFPWAKFLVGSDYQECE